MGNTGSLIVVIIFLIFFVSVVVIIFKWRHKYRQKSGDRRPGSDDYPIIDRLDDIPGFDHFHPGP